MIVVRLMGGMGNQMFQYAFAKSLSIRKNTALKIDASLLGEQDVKMENAVIRHFDLDVFNLDVPFASKEEIEFFNGKINPDFWDRLQFMFNSFFCKHKLVLQNENEFDKLQLENIGNDACLVGRWQSELFFEENSVRIKKLFSFNSFTSNDYSVNISKNIKSGISLGVHVRRGDYITNPIYSQGIGALSVQYYYNALEIVKDKISDNLITYYFFSDDIPWCKKVFSNLPNVVFVEQEKTKIGYVSDMWLLSLCDHVIISNSTFAWWGAYLGEKQDSIICAPEIWAKKKSFTPDNIVPDRWVKVMNTFEV